VQHRVEALRLEQAVHRGFVPEVHPGQAAGEHGPFVAGGKVVRDDDVVPLPGELEQHVTADVAGAAGEEEVHVLETDSRNTTSIKSAPKRRQEAPPQTTFEALQLGRTSEDRPPSRPVARAAPRIPHFSRQAVRKAAISAACRLLE
jgi:hypothetical protein